MKIAPDSRMSKMSDTESSLHDFVRMADVVAGNAADLLSLIGYDALPEHYKVSLDNHLLLTKLLDEMAKAFKAEYMAALKGELNRPRLVG